MLVLAVDTALAACSAALYDSTADRVLAERFEPMQRGHAERLAGMVEEIMREAETPFSAIDRLAATTGPGTFTGVRIGLAFARGLALALDRPTVGITTLQALAAAAAPQCAGRPVAALIDARRGEVYLQAFSPDVQPLTPPVAVALDDVIAHLPDEDVLAVGSGASLVQPHASRMVPADALDLPDPATIARLAAIAQAPAHPPAPVYLRRPDAKQQAPLLKLPAADVAIIQAGAGHADVLATIHAECFTEPWPAAEIESLLWTPGTCAFIASENGSAAQPLGFIIIRQAADEAEILTIATRPQARRRAVASALLTRALETLAATGCADLHLEVDQDNAAARAFYASRGFAETGRRKDYYKHPGGISSDALLLHRKL